MECEVVQEPSAERSTAERPHQAQLSYARARKRCGRSTQPEVGQGQAEARASTWRSAICLRGGHASPASSYSEDQTEQTSQGTSNKSDWAPSDQQEGSQESLSPSCPEEGGNCYCRRAEQSRPTPRQEASESGGPGEHEKSSRAAAKSGSHRPPGQGKADEEE